MFFQRILSFLVFPILVYTNTFSQELFEYHSGNISSSLLENADAVVRKEITKVQIENQGNYSVDKERVVTVLNNEGIGLADTYQFYDPSIKIENIEIFIYDKDGREIKKFKKKDFKDRSIYDGFSLMSDNRIKYIDYTPTSYPFTIQFITKIKSDNTAWIPQWSPIPAYKLSVEYSSYNLVCKPDLELRFLERNFPDYEINYNNNKDQIDIVLKNSKAITYEVLSPTLSRITPNFKVVLDYFQLEGVEGYATDWKTFGKWMYDNLLKDRDQIAPETILEVNTLVENAQSDKEKIKIIYEYLQDKTRYVSIQLGIGGWLPFLAEDVDRLGYGDCKALTNYTKALLKTQGIASYYSVIYAGKERKDIEENFTSLQGNHVILNVPLENEDIWLECTSQTTPFNFLGTFTDHRNALVIKPEGGEIRKTIRYPAFKNQEFTKAEVKISNNGAIEASFNRKSTGLKFDEKEHLFLKDESDLKTFYLNQFYYVPGLKVLSKKLTRDIDSISTIEEIELASDKYLKKAGRRFLLTPNLFNRCKLNLSENLARQHAIEILRGFVEKTDIIINLPKNHTIDHLPAKKNLKSKYGEYRYELVFLSEDQLQLKRDFMLFEGTYTKQEYNDLKNFISEVNQIDLTKIVLKPKTTN